MGRMCPPQSVKMWPTPACLSVRATRCPPFRSAMDPLRAPLPELLPPDALAVHAFLDEGVADGVDGVATAAGIDDEAVHAVHEAVDHLGGLARLAAPRGRRLAHGGDIGEAGVAARQRAKLGVIEEPGGIASPEDEDGGTAEAGLVEIGQDGAHGDDADLLGEEDGAARVGAIEDETARGAFELDDVADLETSQPLRAYPGRCDVDGQGEHTLARRRGEHAPRANRLGAEGHGDPLPRL